MWPYLKNKKRGRDSLPDYVSEEAELRRRPLTLEQLVEGIGDCADLADNDVPLKFWLPEPAMHAMKELAELYSRTMSRMLREFLIIHCYGVYVYEWVREHQPNIFHDDDGIQFSRKREELPPGKIRIHTYFVPELGKNIAPMKIWVPARLKEDLGILAEHMELTTSNYVREIVISRFFGHGTLPMRPRMLDVISSPVAEEWNEDGDVPWKVVSEEEYSQAEVTRHESAIVDE